MHLPLNPLMWPAKRLARKKAKAHGRRGVKSWMHWWLFPPGLWEKGRRFVRRELAADRSLSPPQNPTPLVEILFPQPGPEPYWIPVEKIVTLYGQSFSREQHHFVRYLDSGFDDFKSFYRIHQPKSELQARFIDRTLPGLTGTGVWGAPWLPAPLDETATPLDPVHFGPVSDLELATEAARLDEVLHSIRKYGFFAEDASRPGGQITSQIFYKVNGDFRIIVHHGNHRPAVLSHLGWELIPLNHQAKLHPVRLSDLAQWPGVVAGRFSRETARAMFEALFRPTRQQLLPGW